MAAKRNLPGVLVAGALASRRVRSRFAFLSIKLSLTLSIIGAAVAGTLGSEAEARVLSARQKGPLAPDSASTCTPSPGLGCVRGTIFEDLDHDGTLDPGEPGKVGWLVHLTGPSNASAVTDSGGQFVFPPIPYGHYTVTELVPTGCSAADPPPLGSADVDVTSSQPAVIVYFPVHCGSACTVSYEWRPGKAIEVNDVRWWPQGLELDCMRPGDAIVITASAIDFDTLVQKCVDCNGREKTFPWAPFTDHLQYVWKLETEADRGRLVIPPASEARTIIYQMPKCGWKAGGRYVTLRDTVDLEVRNPSGGPKASDPPHTGTRVVFTMIPCPDFLSETCIKVTVAVTMGSSPPSEVLTPTGDGECDVSPPAWFVDSPIAAGQIVSTEVQDLCPDYVTLLSVDPSDSDLFELTCTSSSPACVNNTLQASNPDAFYYTWTLVSGRGEFATSARGSVVAFRRSRSADATVECKIENYGNRFNDPPVVLRKTISSSILPRAFVALGDDAFLGGHLADLTNAYRLAADRYADAGYAVVREPFALRSDIITALGSPCYQAIWMAGHGRDGTIFMQPGGPRDGVNPTSISGGGFGCRPVNGPHPFIREIVALGCLTYSPDWKGNLVCGRAFSFDKSLFGSEGIGNAITLFYSVNPYEWERDEHHPVPAHDLSLP